MTKMNSLEIIAAFPGNGLIYLTKGVNEGK